MKVKDYLILKEIELWLENEKQDLLVQNNGFYNNPINKIEELLKGLKRIVNKLEKED